MRTPDGELVADHPRHFGRNQEVVHPDHAKAVRELNGRARQNREISALLSVGGVALEYLNGLKEKRVDYRTHVRRINDQIVTYGSEAVGAALAQAHEHLAYSSDAVLNLIEARSRLAPANDELPQLCRNQELLELQTPQTDLTQYDRKSTND